MADSQLVKIPVGDDLFRADVIQAVCSDAEFGVRLVRNEHPETGRLIALQPSYLLVRAEDVQPVIANR
jgi:hypothetical protein